MKILNIKAPIIKSSKLGIMAAKMSISLGKYTFLSREVFCTRLGMAKERLFAKSVQIQKPIKTNNGYGCILLFILDIVGNMKITVSIRTIGWTKAQPTPKMVCL